MIDARTMLATLGLLVVGCTSNAPPIDPNADPWLPVPEDQVADVCRLDPDRLHEADLAIGAPWAIVRYGRLCHTYLVDDELFEAFSTTKTLGALVSGIVAYETAGLADTGRKTGPFTDVDRVDHWLDTFDYNPDAQVAHVLAMVAHNTSLAYGQRTMEYDIVGGVQINSMSDVLNAAIAQDPVRLGANLEEFTTRFLFQPLGMTHSTWSGGNATKVFAFSWRTTLRDMARVGLLMLNGGVWEGQRILDEEWIYRMTHPSFEDANTGYGYLTWLNAADNYTFGGIPLAPDVTSGPMPCAPVSIYETHPHGLSESPDCGYDPPYRCDQPLDVGVWQAVGIGGQVIQGHPGLDMVIVAHDVTPAGTGPGAPGIVWDAARWAVIDADPTYAGDATSFCAAYGGNAYAPDLGAPPP